LRRKRGKKDENEVPIGQSHQEIQAHALGLKPPEIDNEIDEDQLQQNNRQQQSDQGGRKNKDLFFQDFIDAKAFPNKRSRYLKTVSRRVHGFLGKSQDRLTRSFCRTM
jgi:hypothetical protein